MLLGKNLFVTLKYTIKYSRQLFQMGNILNFVNTGCPINFALFYTVFVMKIGPNMIIILTSGETKLREILMI